MYRITYDDKSVFDIHQEDEIVTDASLTGKVNAPDYLDFTISIHHALYDIIEERAGIVKAYSNDEEIFEGIVESIDTDTYGYKKISCVSALDYLNDTHVRPYTTIPEEGLTTAPDAIDLYFKWLIDQHNSHSFGTHQDFFIGVNQGQMMNSTNHLYAKAENLPKTADEIEDKILNKYGGYLQLRYQGENRYLDLYSDVNHMNSQIIDFGVNITKFEKKLDTKNQYTAVRPSGKTPNPPEGSQQKQYPITISSLSDDLTGLGFDLDIKKSGDVVYSQKNLQRYGYHEYIYQDDSIEDPNILLKFAVVQLTRLVSPETTIEVKAVDLSLYMDDYTMLRVGDAVRVRSKLHHEDEYLMVESIDLDLNNPEQSMYTLGAAFDTLTGQQSKYLKKLNAAINASLDAVGKLDTSQGILEANAVTGTKYWYAVTNNPTDIPPDNSWSENRPNQTAGKYLWQKSLITYGDGHEEYTQPVMISGNSASVLHIDSSNGVSFKNNNIATILTVSIFYGSNKITDIVGLHKIFGDSAHLSWFEQRKDDENAIAIEDSDSRLGASGFSLKVSPQDVDEKTIFTCSMDN